MITRKQVKPHYNAGSDVVIGIMCDLSRQVDKQQQEIETLHSRVAKLTKHSKNSSNYQLDACPECQHPDVVFVDEPPRVIQQVELKEVVVIKEEHRSFPNMVPTL